MTLSICKAYICMLRYADTVVLEAPIGQSSDVWSLVQPLLARRTRVSAMTSWEHIELQLHNYGKIRL